MTEADNSGTKGVGSETLDNWHVGVMVSLQYTLDRKMWKKIDDTFGSKDSDETRRKIEKRIEGEVTNAIQTLMPQYDLEYLLDHRTDLEKNVALMLGLPGDWETGPAVHPIFRPSSPPGGSLKDIGITVVWMAFQFDTPPKYDQEKNQIAFNRLAQEEADTRASQLRHEQAAAKEKLEVSRIEAESNSESALAMLRVTEGVSPTTAFIQKWNGNLPQILVSSGVTDLIGDLIRLRDLAGPNENPTTAQSKK